MLAPVAGDPEQEAHGPLDQVAVVVLARVPTEHDVRPLGGSLAGQHAGHIRVDPRRHLALFGRVALVQVAGQTGEDGLDGHRGAIGQRHLEGALQGHLPAPEEQVAPVGLDQAGVRVPVVELVLPAEAGALHVGRPQEPPGVGADQAGQVGLLPHEGGVGDPLLQDDLHHGEGQGGVVTRRDRHVVVGVHVRRVEVGGDRHDLGAVVPGFEHVVVEGDAGEGRVHVPDEHELGVEPVVGRRHRVPLPERLVQPDGEVVEGRVEVERPSPDHIEEAIGREHGGHLGSTLPNDRLRPPDGDGVEHGVGHLVEGLVPADALPLAAAALAHPPHRVQQAVAVVELLAPARSLVAPHRVGVGHTRLGGDERGSRLLPEDPVTGGVDPVRTVARVAVDAVGSPPDRLPGPSGPVGVLRPLLPSGTRHLDYVLDVHVTPPAPSGPLRRLVSPVRIGLFPYLPLPDSKSQCHNFCFIVSLDVLVGRHDRGTA